MPKKKPVSKKPVYKEFESVDALTDDEKDQQSDGYTYHATFCPTWRTEIACGAHDELDIARGTIIDVAQMDFNVTPILTWQQVDTDNWIATGYDGQVETVMTIAKIERVAE